MLNHVGKMTVAAHRGDSYNFYENTMTAFLEAISAGADMIETDVHLTKDNELILMHDHSAKRTAHLDRETKDMTLDEFMALNVGNELHPEKVPLFEDLLKLCAEKGIMVNIEIKEYYVEGNEERCFRCIDDTLALVEKYNMREKIVINSFDGAVLEYVYKKHGKKYMLHGFYPYSIMSNVTLNPDDYLYCACIFDDFKKEYFDYLIAKNIEPWIGASVTQIYRFEACAKFGAKLVTTNNPKDTITTLKELGLRK